MKKSALVLCLAAFFTMAAKAQTVQEGIMNLHAERYVSAKNVFDKLIASNPNNIEATYWLGQTYLSQDNVTAARDLYSRALSSNGNAPLLMVGMGHVELAEGKKGEALQRFEAALAASKNRKGNDPTVLTAVGRANVANFSDAKPVGDINYAIAKLNEAIAIDPAPETYLVLGNAWRKKHDGSQAAKAYFAAPSYAPALYRVAMLYKTQTSYRQPDTWGAVIDNLQRAISVDSRFAPAYEELYYYNLLAKRDFAEAEQYANKYIAAADQTAENKYFLAQTQYVQNKFPEAIATANQIMAETNNNPRPRVYRLLAYSNLGLKDTAAACNFTQQYFAKSEEEDRRGEDYILHAYSCAKGNMAMIEEDITKAVTMDSSLRNQVLLLNDAAKEAKKNNQRLLEAKFNEMSYQIRGTQVDANELIGDIALPYYFGGAYQKADSAAQVYARMLPDSIHGHYWSALARTAIDTNMQQGLAMDAYKKTLEIAAKDKARFKTIGVRAASQLAIYNYNVKEDKAAALAYATQGLEFDPANANLLNIQKVASTKTPAATPARPATPAKKNTKTSTSANSAKEVKVKVESGKTKVKKG